MNGSMPRDYRAAVRVILYPWLIFLPSFTEGGGGKRLVLGIARARAAFACIVHIMHKPNGRPEIREIPFFRALIKPL